ncbi:unnamed protein product [Lupinus luteus]|uniref:RRM domain-containing protein n=1 Tax=Lupinus luteus TaxID=3873 RepID=A0AAV1YH04_LUPLU
MIWRERGRVRVRDRASRRFKRGSLAGDWSHTRRVRESALRPHAENLFPHKVARVSSRQLHSFSHRERQGSWGGLNSFYITNFLEDANSKDLWSFFQKWGRVRDVYIPDKRNKNNQRFAFIRFENVSDERKLALDLDKLWFGKSKIFANIPRFLRNDVKSRRVGVQKTGRQWGGSSNIRDGRSYVEAVRGRSVGVVPRSNLVARCAHLEPKEIPKVLSFSSDKQEVERLLHCYVGRMVKSIAPSKVSASLINAGLVSASALSMGGGTSIMVRIENVLKVLIDGIKVKVVVWEESCGFVAHPPKVMVVKNLVSESSDDDDGFSEIFSEWASDSLGSEPLAEEAENGDGGRVVTVEREREGTYKGEEVEANDERCIGKVASGINIVAGGFDEGFKEGNEPNCILIPDSSVSAVGESSGPGVEVIVNPPMRKRTDCLGEVASGEKSEMLRVGCVGVSQHAIKGVSSPACCNMKSAEVNPDSLGCEAELKSAEHEESDVPFCCSVQSESVDAEPVHIGSVQCVTDGNSDFFLGGRAPTKIGRTTKISKKVR